MKKHCFLFIFWSGPSKPDFSDLTYWTWT